MLPLVTPTSLTRRTRAHEVDWARSDGRALVTYDRSGLPDTEITVTLAACRRCDIPLLLVSRCDDETGYMLALEILGMARTARQ